GKRAARVRHYRDPDCRRAGPRHLRGLVLHLYRSLQGGALQVRLRVRGGADLRSAGVPVRQRAGASGSSRGTAPPGIRGVEVAVLSPPTAAIESLQRRPLRLRRALRLNLIAIPLLLAVSFVWAYPFLWVVSTAFKTQLGAFTAGASLVPHPLVTTNFV